LKKLDIPRVVIILVVGGFINSVGNSLMWPLNSLYMHNELGRTLTEAGIVLALQAACALIGQFLSGFIVDRVGARKVMIYGLVASGAVVGLIGLFPSWEVYAPSLILFGLAQAFVFVPLNALIRLVWPEGGRRGFNLLYVFNNAGVAVGTALGGIVAQISFTSVFLLDSATFFIYLLIVIFGLKYKDQPQHKEVQHQAQRLTQDKGFATLMALSGGIFLTWGAYIQLITILPVVMNGMGYSLPAYSILWTLNGIFIVALQPVISWVINKWAQTFQRQFYLALVLLAVAFIILLGNLPYASYILAIFILTLGEMLILPAVPAAAAQLAPLGKEGTYQGVIAAAASGGRMLGPLLGGLVYDFGGGSKVWVLSLLFLVAAAGSFSLYGPLEKRFNHPGKEKATF